MYFFYTLFFYQSHPWILDTGATDHVCHSQALFQKLVIIPKLTVKLPNGASITTNKVGTIIFNDNFYLNNVLHISDFFTNLIFIPRNTKSLNYRVMFNVDNYIIQEILSKRMIGATKLHLGIYYLTILNQVSPFKFPNHTSS